MAPATRAAARRAIAVADIESDYGSDVDEAAIAELLGRSESQSINPIGSLALESIESCDPLPSEARLPFPNASPGLQIYKPTSVDQDGAAWTQPSAPRPAREHNIEIEYDESDRTTFSPRKAPEEQRRRIVSAEPEEPNVNDTRSPLERFRSKRPISVTDIVSPAWCELQYWYSLTKYGRVKKTPAMRQGSSVHKVLEEQVHTAVPVDVDTKEDRFGLRIWNIVQGLRTLRATGMTRELEVWGVIEGQVVNGIIDEVSFTCSDEELEERIESTGLDKKKRSKPLPANQRTMEAFFPNSNGNTETSEIETGWLGSLHAPARKVYLTDVKTRGSRKLPDEVSIRPSQMQLMIYHNLLGLLSSNSVPAEKVFERYNLDPTAAFSDTFISQIGGLDFNFHENAGTEGVAPFESSQDSIDELLSHNCLEKLWELMMTEFAHTMPGSAGAPAIGNVLRVEYRASGTGDIVGVKAFGYDAQKLDSYVQQEIAWWKGERPARGVDVEEAFKCRMCEFANACTWRQEKVEEGLRKARLRRDERRRSEV